MNTLNGKPDSSPILSEQDKINLKMMSRYFDQDIKHFETQGAIMNGFEPYYKNSNLDGNVLNLCGLIAINVDCELILRYIGTSDYDTICLWGTNFIKRRPIVFNKSTDIEEINAQISKLEAQENEEKIEDDRFILSEVAEPILNISDQVFRSKNKIFIAEWLLRFSELNDYDVRRSGEEGENVRKRSLQVYPRLKNHYTYHLSQLEKEKISLAIGSLGYDFEQFKSKGLDMTLFEKMITITFESIMKGVPPDHSKIVSLNQFRI